MTVVSFARAAAFDDISEQLKHKSAQERILMAYELFGNKLVLTSSFGVQSAVLLHMATDLVPKIPVVFVDTGYLFPETYRFVDELRGRLDLNLHIYNPRRSAAMQEALEGARWNSDEAAKKAYNLENKVEPMNRAIKELGAKAWLSGVRAEQSDYRAGMSFAEAKENFVKFYPILDWSERDVFTYLSRNDLPVHPLFAQGYTSIGDRHSSFPKVQRTECGLHDDTAAPRPLDFQI